MKLAGRAKACAATTGACRGRQSAYRDLRRRVAVWDIHAGAGLWAVVDADDRAAQGIGVQSKPSAAASTILLRAT